jgi:hypothetical protein
MEVAAEPGCEENDAWTYDAPNFHDFNEADSAEDKENMKVL